MNYPKVYSKHNFHWVLFNQIYNSTWDNEGYDDCYWLSGSYWDMISDKEIKKQYDFINNNLRKIDYDNLNIDWQQIKNLHKLKEKELKELHAYRIALIAKRIQQYGINEKDIIEIDFINPHLISDGHHRIRAIRYLKYQAFPAFIGGWYECIEWAEKEGIIIPNKKRN